MLYWIGLILCVTAIMAVGLALIYGVYLLGAGIVDKLGKLIPEPKPAQEEVLIRAPRYIAPGDLGPGKIPDTKDELADDRKRLAKMTVALAERFATLLIREGVDQATAQLIAKAYACDERVGEIPFADDTYHSEYCDDLMPATGPLQTAANEIATAVVRGIGADVIALKLLQEKTTPVFIGWHATVKNT